MKPAPSRIKVAAEFFLVAAAYDATGRLGLLLAGPEGFASPIYPAAGLALAAALLYGRRSLPAIFLGAFFANWPIAVAVSAGSAFLNSTPPAAAIAAGVTLQAALGAWLVRRFVGDPCELARGREVLGFLFLGGPLASLISATVGVTSLVLAGTGRAHRFAADWFNWWTGDSIGAMIVAPAILLWRPPSFRGRRLAVLLPTGVALALAVLFVVEARRWQPWTALASALLVAALLEALLLVLTGRTVEIEREVAKRTRQLEKQKEELEAQIVERRRAQEQIQRLTEQLEGQVRQRTAQLEAANRELEKDLLERKQAEARLAILANAVESTTEMIGIMDLQERFIFVNRAFQRAYGYTEAEVLGRTPEVLFSTANSPELLEQILRKTREGGWHGEVLQRRRDGTDFPAFLSTSHVTDMTGRMIGLLAVTQDITARKLADKALRESEEKLRSLFEFAPMAIALHDPQGHYLQINQAYQTMVGYTCEELRRLGNGRVTHPNDLDEDRRFQDELRRGARDHYRRFKRYLSRDGRLVWAQAFTSSVRDEEGRLRYIISMVEDVTDRRRAEAGLHELAAIVETSNDAIVSMTPEGVVVSWNKAAEAIYGYTAEEMIGRPMSRLLPAGASEEEAALFRKVAQGGKTGGYETLRRRRDGSLIEVSLSLSPIRDAAGKVTGVSSIAHDITERKRLEKELLEISANERRRIGHELHDGLGQHLAGIALKTKALEQMLAGDLSEPAAAAKQIVALLNDAIRQCRELARGLDPVHVEAHGLPAALENLARQSQHLFNVPCRFRCGLEDLRVNPKAGLALYRIAQEAIRNGAVHGLARQIHLDLDLDEANLCLKIHDDGGGFTPGAKPESGMGLHTMRYRANSIGGVLTIESKSGSGTRVQCVVPARLCVLPKSEPFLPQGRQ